jgi:hypothetical protein
MSHVSPSRTKHFQRVTGGVSSSMQHERDMGPQLPTPIDSVAQSVQSEGLG